MKNKQKKEKIVDTLNLGLTESLLKRLDAFCLKLMARNGKIRHGLKTKIARMALEEWLDKHENDSSLKI